jgi:hypothetical protein
MAEAMFWESIVKPEMDPDFVEDFNSFSVQIDVAGHQFNHHLIHLWIDPMEEAHPEVHSLTTIDMTIDEARALVKKLKYEIGMQQGKAEG